MPTLVERFVQDLERVSDLPSKPQVLMRLVSALGRDGVSLGEIAGIIRQDPALASQVLKIANSAAFAPRTEILSVSEGVMRIGLSQTRRLALALSLYNMVPRPGFFAHQQAFWLHSLGTAHAAALIVRRGDAHLDAFDEEEMFLLGLFHDVGLIALAGYYPQEHDAVKRFAQRSELPYYAAEISVLGTDHGELGAILATYWGLPGAAVEVIRTHHRLEAVPPALRQTVQILQVAEFLCQGAGIADLGEGWTAGIDGTVFEELGLSPGSASDLIWEVRGETERMEAVLAVAR